MSKPYTIHHGCCLDVLQFMPSNSVDSIVTDPPYGLSFMGKKWDYDVPSVEIWAECLRVLKPGGHLLSFAGTRTQHRMCCRIEDAGFEIRDMIAWVYGSGFPKSLNISHLQPGFGTALKPASEPLTWATKPLDCLGHCANMIVSLNEKLKLCRQNVKSVDAVSKPTPADSRGVKTNTAPANAVTLTGAVHKNGTEIGKVENTNLAVATLESTLEMESIVLNTLLSWRNTLGGVHAAMSTSTTSTAFEMITDWRILSYLLLEITPENIIREKFNPNGLSADALHAMQYLNASLACLQNTLALSVLAPAMSKEADTCRGVDISPNLEPITLARKPLIGTVAANVLEWGTGGINVDGCRVGMGDDKTPAPTARGDSRPWFTTKSGNLGGDDTKGRWPANLIHDGSEEVTGLFPQSKTPGTYKRATAGEEAFQGAVHGKSKKRPEIQPGYGDEGSTARFFYCAKASRSERDAGCEDLDHSTPGEITGGRQEGSAGLDNPRAGAGRTSGGRNVHPTVKPLALMRYLVRLVTPPGGVVLDPFLGSGTTAVAALQEGFRCIGIERDEHSHQAANARVLAEYLNSF